MNANQFKEWRKTIGINQEQAAIALGISRPTIARYEKNTAIPKYIELACKQLLTQEELNSQKDSQNLSMNGFADLISGLKFTKIQRHALWLIFVENLSKEQSIAITGIDAKELDGVYDIFFYEVYPPHHKKALAYFKLKASPLQPYSKGSKQV